MGERAKGEGRRVVGRERGIGRGKSEIEGNDHIDHVVFRHCSIVCNAASSFRHHPLVLSRSQDVILLHFFHSNETLEGGGVGGGGERGIGW